MREIGGNRRFVVRVSHHLMLLNHILNFACDCDDLPAVQTALLHYMLSHYSLISIRTEDVLEGAKCNVFLPQNC